MKKKEWQQGFRYFIVTYSEGRVVRFDARPGVHLSSCVISMVEFLRTSNIDDEYVLHFNDDELKISRFSKSKDVVNQYWESKRSQGHEL